MTSLGFRYRVVGLPETNFYNSCRSDPVTATPQTYSLSLCCCCCTFFTFTYVNSATRGGAASTDHERVFSSCFLVPILQAGILEPAPSLIIRRRHHAPRFQMRHPRSKEGWSDGAATIYRRGLCKTRRGTPRGSPGHPSWINLGSQ